MPLTNTTGREDQNLDDLIGLSETLRDSAQVALDTTVRLDSIIEEKNEKIEELRDRIKELEEECEGLRDRLAERENS